LAFPQHQTKEKKRMIGYLRKGLTYSNVMATIAVFLVLGGGAAMAAGLAKNSVKTKNIKNGAVTTSKLAADAVTGQKANESTFGIVPSAQSAKTADTATKATTADTATKAVTAATAATATTADTATKATTADTATKATTADSATTATSATTADSAKLADDAELFDGRSIAEVRGGVTALSTTTDVGIPDPGIVVAAVNVQVSAAGDLLTNASLRITNNGAQGFMECRLENEGDGSFEPMSQFAAHTMPAGNTIQIPLTGIADNVPAKGVVDPETVRVFCDASNVGGPFVFESGDVIVQRVAIG
jgi:hypothetical protein